MNDEFFEIRVFLIGDLGIGKKSIVQRFKKLNTTKTSIDKYFIQKDPRDAYEHLYRMSIHNYNNYSLKYFFYIIYYLFFL